MHNNKGAVIAAVSAGVIAVSLLYWSDEIVNLFYALVCESGLLELRGIEKGIYLLRQNISRLEALIESSGIGSEVNTLISIASSDVDFLFSALDNIRGSTDVRQKRKLLVDQVKDLSNRLDLCTHAAHTHAP